MLSSCNLDETPYGFYSEDNFYKTEADAEAAVNLSLIHISEPTRQYS